MITPEVVSEARRRLGRQLAAYREGAGLNQQQLASMINYGRSTVANAETGYSICSRTFWVRCDQALQLSGAILGGYDDLQGMIRRQRLDSAQLIEEQRLDRFCEQPDIGIAAAGDRERAAARSAWSRRTSPDTVDDMKRRTALALPALPLFATTLPPAEPWLRIKHALQHPEQLDELAVETLEARTAELFHLEEHLPARQLADQVEAQVATLEHLVEGSRSTLGHRLLASLGEVLALAGWIAWDCGQHARARERYLRALAVAEQAGDGPLTACVLAYRSYATEAEGDLVKARQVLAAGQGYVRSEGSATTRAWLAAREAEVDAALGETTPALRALERAMTAYDYAHPYQERVWTAFFTPSRLGSMAVTTYARLRHPHLDQTTEAVVNSLPDTKVKIKAVVLADAAIAAVQGDQYEQGAGYGRAALDSTLAHEASIGKQRLGSLRTMIQTKPRVAALAELDDHLRACLV